MLNNEEMEFLKRFYPTRGKKWCCDKLNKKESEIRISAAKLKLKLDKNSDFFKDFQKRAAFAKIGKKRPEHSKLMKKKFVDGEVCPPNNRKHGLSRSKSYSIWNSMMARCYKIKSRSYKSYGERGIEVCKEWHDVVTFIKWYDKNYIKDLTLERVDFNGNYCPENCTFVTVSEQARNRRSNVVNREKVNIIRNIFSEGITQRRIAEIFGLTFQEVNSIVLNKIWKN